MYKPPCVLILLLLNTTYCWVFNNIDYAELEARMSADDADNRLGEDEDFLAEERISLIYPGTKWCGAGNIAMDFDDLGTAVETDKCCREHDLCPDIILAGETRHNLTNEAFYTRLSCKCDERFRMCLHNSGERQARRVGKIYFNVIGTQCFREDYPTIGCKKKGGWLHTKCVQYEYDTNGTRRYQWFDVPNYDY